MASVNSAHGKWQKTTSMHEFPTTITASLRPSDAYICVSKLPIIGSDNGLSPDRRQAIIWANAGILLIGPLGTNFGETLIEILTFSFKKMRLKVSSAKWRPFCLGLNVLITKQNRTNNNKYRAITATKTSIQSPLNKTAVGANSAILNVIFRALSSSW